MPREFKPVDLEEVLAESLCRRVSNPRSEAEREAEWPALQQALADSQRVPPWVFRRLAAAQQSAKAG